MARPTYGREERLDQIDPDNRMGAAITYQHDVEAVLTAAEVRAALLGLASHTRQDSIRLRTSVARLRGVLAPAGPEADPYAAIAPMEQELAETTRLLRELYDTARDLDAWTSARHAEVLRKVEAHLARTVTP